MKYLLDLNALVALGFLHHEFHDRLAAWIQAQRFPPLATCSITELGFVRVLSHAPIYGFTVAQAKTSLLRLKKAKVLPFTFLSDGHDISHLPAMGQDTQTDHRRPPGAAWEREWSGSRDTGRESTRRLYHSLKLWRRPDGVAGDKYPVGALT